MLHVNYTAMKILKLCLVKSMKWKKQDPRYLEGRIPRALMNLEVMPWAHGETTLSICGHLFVYMHGLYGQIIFKKLYSNRDHQLIRNSHFCFWIRGIRLKNYKKTLLCIVGVICRKPILVTQMVNLL
jgi:hypothetical protein